MRRSTVSIGIVVAASVLSCGDDEVPSGAFLADADGYVVFEVEAIAGAEPPAPWEYGTQPRCFDGDEGSSCAEPLGGGGYYRFTGADACGQERETNVGEMSVQFQIARTGLYRMAWRNMRDHSGGCGEDRNNDSFVTFPSATEEAAHRAPFKVFGGGSNSFNWTANQDNQNSGEGAFTDTNKRPVCVEFEEGVHEMRIAGRSQNHTIDRIAFIPVEGDISACQERRVIQDLDDRPLTGRQE